MRVGAGRSESGIVEIGKGEGGGRWRYTIGGLANRARRGAEEVELFSTEGAREQPGTEVAVVEASPCIALRKKKPPCRGQLTTQGRRSEQAAQVEPAAHQAVLAAALKQGLA